MPNFSSKSRDILSWAHPDLRKVLEEAIKVVDFSVLESVRTEEQHNKNVKDGKSKTTWEKSKHRPRIDNDGRLTSMAVDIAPYPIDFSNKQRFNLVAGVILGIAHVLRERGTITHQIRWGGDFNQNWDPTDDKFYDGPHFELM